MRIFRSLRILFIEEGKTRKYLVYAVGEILLVMIGIVLAFQVDNWNDARIKRKSERIIYQNIYDQLVTDKEKLLSEKNFDSLNRIHIDFISEKLIANDRSMTDSIGKIMVHMLQYSDYDKQSALYSDMVGGGEIKLVTEKDIITGLRELEEQFFYLNRMEDIHYDIIMTHLSPFINQIVRYSTGEVKDEASVYSHELENSLLLTRHVMDEKKMVYEYTMDRIDLLLAELEALR